MNSFRRLLSTPLLAALAIAALAWAATAQQREPAAETQPGAELSATQVKSVRSAVANARSLSLYAVVLKRQGTLDQLDAYVAELMKEVERQGVSRWLEGFEPASILVLYEDPAGKREVSLAVGLTTPGSPAVKPPLSVERYFEDKAVRAPHTGPYEQLGQVYEVVADAVNQVSRNTEAAGFPVVLRLINDPELVQRSQIRTEMIVPVESRAPATLSREASSAIRRSMASPRDLSQWIVSQTFEGSVEETGAMLEKFMAAFSEQGLGEKLPSPDTAPLAILHGNPEEQKTIKIEIGFPVAERVEAKEPLAVRELSLPRSVAVTHSGHYDELGAVYRQIEQAAARLTGGSDPGWPVALRLLTDPRKVNAPSQIRTELIVPLEGSKG